MRSYWYVKMITIIRKIEVVFYFYSQPLKWSFSSILLWSTFTYIYLSFFYLIFLYLSFFFFTLFHLSRLVPFFIIYNPIAYRPIAYNQYTLSNLVSTNVDSSNGTSSSYFLSNVFPLSSSRCNSDGLLKRLEPSIFPKNPISFLNHSQRAMSEVMNS